MPASPLPAMRTLLPSRTPAGMLTLSRLIVRRAPQPPQVAHGSSMIEPEPPQRWHGFEIEKTPWPCCSTPRPWQTGQIVGAVPGLAPEPWQVSQVVEVGTASDVCVPSTASSKLSVTSVSRSRPRWARGRAVRCPAPPEARPAPAPPPNRFERMSLKLPPKAHGSKPPPAGPPGANGPVPRSYALRFSGSESTS